MWEWTHWCKEGENQIYLAITLLGLNFEHGHDAKGQIMSLLLGKCVGVKLLVDPVGLGVGKQVARSGADTGEVEVSEFELGRAGKDAGLLFVGCLGQEGAVLEVVSGHSDVELSRLL